MYFSAANFPEYVYASEENYMAIFIDQLFI